MIGTDGEKFVFHGRELSYTFEPESRAFQLRDAKTGEVIPHVFVYWFAWQAFYPDTEVFGG